MSVMTIRLMAVMSAKCTKCSSSNQKCYRMLFETSTSTRPHIAPLERKLTGCLLLLRFAKLKLSYEQCENNAILMLQ